MTVRSEDRRQTVPRERQTVPRERSEDRQQTLPRERRTVPPERSEDRRQTVPRERSEDRQQVFHVNGRLFHVNVARIGSRLFHVNGRLFHVNVARNRISSLAMTKNTTSTQIYSHQHNFVTVTDFKLARCTTSPKAPCFTPGPDLVCLLLICY